MTRINLFLLVLVALLLAAVIAGASVGAAGITPRQVVSIWCSPLTGESLGSFEPWQRVVMFQVRLPRIIVGLVVGGGLAATGAVMQGLFRNPLADPGVLGVSGAASAGAVFAIYTGLALQWTLALPLFAFVTALATATAVYLLATERGRTAMTTLLLAGMAANSLAAAAVSIVLSLSVPQWEISTQILYWLMGGLNGRTWTHVWICLPLVMCGSATLAFFARDLDVLAGGEETAQSLGVDVPTLRRSCLLLASAVTAVCVAVSGAIGFVGLLVPHLIRLLIGPRHRTLLPASFLGGAILLLVADVIARWVTPGGELRLGVLTSLLGGPFFLFLLLQQRRAEGGLP